MTLNNIYELADWFGTTPEHLEKAIYKGTECGAWIRWDDDTVSIGSIVEGSDAEFDETFEFPVDPEDIEAWTDELECLCDEAWHEANDDENEEEDQC